MGSAVAVAINATAISTYVSSTKLFVSAAKVTDAPSAYQGQLFSQQRVTSYAHLLTGAELAQQVVDELHLPLTAREVAGKVVATPLPQTVVIDVQVTDTSPERGQAIAASLARHFEAAVAAIETPSRGGESAAQVSIMQPADFNPVPISPDKGSNLLRGAAVGLAFGVGLALLRSRLDRSIRTTDDVLAATGKVPAARFYENPALRSNAAMALAPGSATAEACRAIRLSVQRSGDSFPAQVVIVTSALPGEGASTVAVTLAASLARTGSRGVLIDANLLRPRVCRYLGLTDSGPGLTEVLTGGVPVLDVVRPWETGNLVVLPPGPLRPDAAEPSTSEPLASELLASARMRSLLEELRATHDFIIIDAPALLSASHAMALGLLADGYLLVGRYGKTKREQLTEAVDRIVSIDAELLGVVLNRVPRSKAPSSADRLASRPDPARRIPADPAAWGAAKRASADRAPLESLPAIPD